MRVGRVKAPTIKLVYDNSMTVADFKMCIRDRLKDETVRLLKTSPEALARFEEAYAASALVPADDLVRFNAKRAAADLPEFIPVSYTHLFDQLQPK